MIAVLASISAGRMAALYRFEPAGDLAQPVRIAEQVRIATSSYRWPRWADRCCTACSWWLRLSHASATSQ